MAVLEEWVDEMGVPPGVLSHFAPVRDLLSWVQVSIVAILLLRRRLKPLAVPVLHLGLPGTGHGNTVLEGYEPFAGKSRQYQVCARSQNAITLDAARRSRLQVRNQ